MRRKSGIRIHQFHSGSAVGDAVTNSMLFVQSILRDLGFESEIFVEHRDARLVGQIRPLNELRVGSRDILLIHHSMGHDALGRLAELRCRRSLVYHNITPPGFFAENDRNRHYAVKGYAQLSLLRQLVEASIVPSAFNARQLQKRDFTDITVIPLLKDFAAMRQAPHAKAPYYDDTAVFRLLFVGRLVAHKCQHELIEFVDEMRAIGGAPVELVLVGSADGGAYKAQLDQLIADAGLAPYVRFAGQVGDRELCGWYRAANAYVSLSEHEGFGVPLIEAMAFDLPVIAYAAAAVPDTLGNAGITLPRKDPAVLRDALLRVCDDRPFRRDLIRAQRRRLLAFSRQRIAAELQRWLAGIGAYDARPAPALDPLEGPAPQPARTHYVIEGPYETSYSLAIVNRNIARALNRRDGSAASIEPAEGVEDYVVDAAAAQRLPGEIRDLVGPAPALPAPIVTIRNTYPPRPNGMLGDFRLLHLAWEESAIPPPLAGLINLHLDGVLVPSQYCRRVLRNSGVRLPIAVIGHGVDHAGAAPLNIERGTRGPVTPSLPFTFLHISSGLARKGIEELVTAYCLAFSRRDPVLLVIKTFDNPQNTVDEWIARATGEQSPAIQIIAEDLDWRRLEFLYRASDAVVLPSRGEGFNLPAAEAMARGLPVIVTRHGGHLDFCNDNNSVLIKAGFEASDSHLRIANSYWARPLLGHLVQAMKSACEAGRPPATPLAVLAAQGPRDAAGLRWSDVARRIDDFTAYLDQRTVMQRRVRLAWVSTYNVRCGIAAYSKHLLDCLDTDQFDVTIFADDQPAVAADAANVVRLWSKTPPGLCRVREALLKDKFDAVFFQHNVSFYDCAEFVDTLLALADAGVNTFVTFHRTQDLIDDDRVISPDRMREALQSCTRLFVHGLDDVNRLRERGVVDNVVLLPHGVIDRGPPPDGDAVRSLLALSGCRPVIGTFGFLLPGKGLPELIHAFALLRSAYPQALLLLVNADYPKAESEDERQRCLALVRLLQLEDHVRLVNDFLDIEETLLLLGACDAIVYPYQRSTESASGAVRLGLAAGRPVLATPLPVFADLAEVVEELPGTEPRDIADGIFAVLRDPARRRAIEQRQRAWVQANSWAANADRLANIMIGCLEETRGLAFGGALRTAIAAAPAVTAPSTKSPAGAVVAMDGAGEDRRPEPPATTRLPRLLRGLAPKPAPAATPEKKAMIRADRARDARDWALAVRYYREALELNPGNPSIWMQFGHALKESGDVGQAEGAYRKSLELNPSIADSHLQLGHALKIQGRRIEAGLAYFRALALDRSLDHALVELRALGWPRGRIELALRRAIGGGA